jgi:hypothetical protein
VSEEIDKINSTHNINIDMALLALRGRPGIFRPAYSEYLQEMFNGVQKAFGHMMTEGWKTFFLQETLECFPCRTLVPLFTEEFFEKISDAFNEEKDIGIIFNSYNPIDGMEYVHPNSVARGMISKRYEQCPDLKKKQRQNQYRDRTCYHEITSEAVRNALWLYQYGFDQQKNAFLDGAYYRQIMLNELTEADKIYVVRPLKYRWVGQLPTSYIGMEDLKTEVGFDGTYAGERNQIMLINRLIKEEMLQRGAYKQIRLCEIEIEFQRGYFDYIFEELEVFKSAYDKALKRFDCKQEDCEQCPSSKDQK